MRGGASVSKLGCNTCAAVTYSCLYMRVLVPLGCMTDELGLRYVRIYVAS